MLNVVVQPKSEAVTLRWACRCRGAGGESSPLKQGIGAAVSRQEAKGGRRQVKRAVFCRLRSRWYTRVVMLTRRELVVTVVLLLVQTGYFFGLRAVQTCALPSAEPELVPMPVRTLPPPTPVPEETTTSPVPEETAPRVVIESPLLIGSPLVIKDRFYIYEVAVARA